MKKTIIAFLLFCFITSVAAPVSVLDQKFGFNPESASKEILK